MIYTYMQVNEYKLYCVMSSSINDNNVAYISILNCSGWFKNMGSSNSVP